ncbi:MAG: DUF2812 domain-containing protein [Lachnospiraceae bacterium]|nr:DUF2812 domain-containing protein [Lachnospiraceae bacterium]
MRKTIIHFFTIADYEEEEIWLRRQHQNGWKLVKLIVPCFYVFESCEPEDVIYRLDYKNFKQTEEYIQLAQDFGWEYFFKCVGWLYFRKPVQADEEEAEELFSDNISRVEMAQQVARTRLIPLTVIFLCCIIPNLLNAVNSRIGGFSVFFGIFFGVMFIIYLYLIIYCGIKLTMIRKKYLN